MSEGIGRRGFLAGAAAASLAGRASARSANETIVVGVMGTGGRGTSHTSSFASIPGVKVGYVCDVDEKRAGQASDVVKKATGEPAQVVGDFRRILDDKGVDVLVVATCNHWHAPAAILGCSAGKHVYVEKPCSHNAREGEILVEAARKYNRVVQMGNQRRSWPKIVEAIDLVRNGEIGPVYYAQSYYRNNRPSIGTGKEGPPPAGLDFDLWQGPAPRRPYRDNILHYNWHWFWHWGNGELGNNGIHYLDVCRWGLGVDYPTRVVSSAGRYRFHDDQETPDTHLVSYEFEGGKQIMWEGLSCSTYQPGGSGNEIVFRGEKGALSISGGGYAIFDAKGTQTKKETGRGGDSDHLNNFLEAIRGNAKPNSEIEEGHKSTTLCHLGNIAHRTGRTITCDPKTGHIVGDADAMKQWSREYAPGWEPKA